MEEQTSLKQMIQSMMPEGSSIIEGTVSGISPLQVTLRNDSKMVLSANSLIVPEHLTDQEVDVDIMMGRGVVHAFTGAEEEKGEHEHPDIVRSGKHEHALKNFTLMAGKLMMYTGLKVGQVVYLLSYNSGKQYYILDRKG